MRSILISVMLIMVALLIYNSVAGGDGGMKKQLKRSGESMSEHISKISP
ncbi:hypothetical protein ACFSTH_10690 [Paenibacillus yanchengensis]|uniref:Uncharacterized protein n=1 Tax=Paenibacillus yanchengensis TaxID=2035833 RepID=A0ABW4YJ87_9BACL